MTHSRTEISPIPDRPDVEDVIDPEHGQESEPSKEQLLGCYQDLIRRHLFNRLCHVLLLLDCVEGSCFCCFFGGADGGYIKGKMYGIDKIGEGAVKAGG
jgi:hypothetical protein